MHKCIPAIREKTNIPLLHIVDATAKEMLKNNIDSALLLGTRFTMEEEFNIKRFKEHFTDNFVYSITIGIVMIYGISIVANMIINFVLGGGSNDSANQLLFEDYLNNGALLMAFQSVILAPILEELLFRGLVFRSLRDKSKWLAIFASSFLFGFLHIYSALFAGDLSQLIYLFSYGGMGFAFSYAYEKRKTICVPILMHMINNLVAIILLVFM